MAASVFQSLKLLPCICICFKVSQFSCSVVSDSATPWTAARQASLPITNSQSLLKLMSIESVMPSKRVILCHPLLLLLSIFPSTMVFSNESVLHIRWPKVSTGDDIRNCTAAVYRKLSLCPLPTEKGINVLKYNQIRELIHGTHP